jgi:hypothetical protein
MNGVDVREPMFYNVKDRELFLYTLGEAFAKTDWPRKLSGLAGSRLVPDAQPFSSGGGNPAGNPVPGSIPLCPLGELNVLLWQSSPHGFPHRILDFSQRFAGFRHYSQRNDGEPACHAEASADAGL